MRTSPSPPPAGYGVALAAIAITFAIRLLLQPLLGGQAPYLLFTIAVVAAAWYGGLAPGLLATVLGALLGTHFFLPPLFSFHLPGQASLTHLVLFSVIGVLISLIGQSRLSGIGLAQSAAQAQRQSEERFAATFEKAAVGIAHVAPDGRWLRINQALCNIVGYSHEELLELTFQDITYPDDLEADLAQVQRLLADEIDHYNMEKRYLRKDGSLIWINLTGSLVRDETGAPDYFIGVIDDISDRKRAEEAQHESDATLQAYYESSPACMGVVELSDDDILHVYDNPATCRFFGVEFGSTHGRWARELGAPAEVIAAWREQYCESASRGGPVQFALPHDFPGRARRWLDITVSPLPAGPSGRARFCYVSVDSTELRQSEAALRESEERLRRVVDGAPIPMLVRAEDGQHFHVNAAWTEVTGYTAEDIPTLESWMQVAYREDAGRITAEVVAELSAGRELHGTEYSIWTKAGERRTLQFYTARVGQNSGGQYIRTTAAIDVTQRRQAEAERERLLEREQSLRAEAEQTNRLKDEFLATLSHELRTPMTAILGWMHLLTRGVLNEEDQTQAFDAIQRNLKLQMQLIEDLLDVSNIIAGKLRLELQPLRVEAVIATALESMHHQAAAKSIRIELDYASDVGEIMGDPGRLQQVTTNLLSNAIKFTPESGQIHVALQRTDSHVELSIRDNGVGISPDFLPHVFDRFRQADSSNTRRTGGLGLGLAIVRHLVELHGGQITAHSQGRGQGATFTVRLPVAPLQASAPEQAPNGTSENDGMPTL